jgi:hypothetical protein
MSHQSQKISADLLTHELSKYLTCNDIIKIVTNYSKEELNSIEWLKINNIDEIDLDLTNRINTTCGFITNNNSSNACNLYFNNCRLKQLYNRYLGKGNPIKYDIDLLNKMLLMTITRDDDKQRIADSNDLLDFGAKEITKIGNNAFKNKRIKHVTIPNSVKTIGNNAFENNMLVNVTIPNSVKTIGNNAFENNTLINVNILDSVNKIGEYAFSKNKLTNVTLPNAIRVIEPYTFYKNRLKEIIIPNSVKYIEKAAFSNNDLISVDMSDSVIKIGEYAFNYNLIFKIKLSSSLNEIEREAFNMNQINSITIPNKVKKIGYRAFYHNQLSTIIIPNSVIEIGREAFALNRFKNVTIPERFKDQLNSIFDTDLKRINFTFTSDIVEEKPAKTWLDWFIPLH